MEKFSVDESEVRLNQRNALARQSIDRKTCPRRVQNSSRAAHSLNGRDSNTARSTVKRRHEISGVSETIVSRNSRHEKSLRIFSSGWATNCHSGTS
jgi:hypothetical protein